MLWNPLGDGRVTIEEIEVFLDGAGGNGPEKPLLRLREIALYHQAEHSLETGNRRQQFFLRFRGQDQHFAIFERFDVNVAGCLIMETGDVAYPPVFYGKLQGNLSASTVDIIGTDAAFENICLKLTNFPLLQEERLFGI